MRILFTVPLSLSLLATGVQRATAQQDDDIYELITTAIHVQRSETALPVTVLTGEELHNAVRSTLGDTLSSQPGINNASFGPAVGQTVIRGQQGRRVMNLSNGLPNADASGNSADHAQTVEAILASSIEVLRGPSTLLYGGGAIGGVINVIDRRIASTLPAAPAFALEARHDTAADISTVVSSLDFATGSLVWHVDAMQRDWNNLDIPGLAIDAAALEHGEHEEEEHEEDEHDEEVANTLGYIGNTAGETSTATVGVSWIQANGFIGFAVNRLNNTYGLPPGTHTEHSDEPEDEEHEEEHGTENVFIDMERTRYDLKGEWHDLAPWAETLAWHTSHTDYAHAEIEGAGEPGTQFSNDSWQHRVQITHTDTTERHGVLGLQYSTEEFAALGAESFIPVTSIDTRGLFMVEDFHQGPLTYEFGARFNLDDYSPRNSAAPGRDFSTWSFSGSALWDVNSTATLGLSVSKSQRAPSVEELYSNFGLTDPDACVIHFATGACEVGSVAFKEETSLNTDLTLYLDYGRFSATLTGFYNRFNDYIGQNATGEEVDGFPLRQYQQDDARFAGIEADFNFQLTEGVDLRVFADTIRGTFENNRAVPRLPPARVGMELKLSGERWSAYTSLLHARQQNQPGTAELPTDAWTRFDAGADYRLISGDKGELLLFIKGRNLGNEEIRLATSYLRSYAPEAGRSVETGLRYRF